MATNSARVNVLITGGSRGIGRAIANQLAARGCRIAVNFNTNEAAAAEAVRALNGDGHAAFRGNVANPSDVERLWREVTAAFGRIDVLINNAGIFEHHPPLQCTPAEWQAAWNRTVSANLLGPATLCHLAARALVEQPTTGDFGRGRIVNISSRGAFRGEPEAPAYGASKAGLNALSQSLAKALAPQHIYVFCLAPGWVETDMAAAHLAGPAGADIRAQHPLGRVATADEVAKAAVFCALDAPPAMTGAIIDVNGASYLRT